MRSPRGTPMSLPPKLCSRKEGAERRPGSQLASACSLSRSAGSAGSLWGMTRYRIPQSYSRETGSYHFLERTCLVSGEAVGGDKTMRVETTAIDTRKGSKGRGTLWQQGWSSVDNVIGVTQCIGIHHLPAHWVTPEIDLAIR